DRRGHISSVADYQLHAPQYFRSGFTYDTLLIRARYGELLGATAITIRPAWWVKDQGLISAYQLETHQPGIVPSYEIWVDAISGEEIQREDRATYFHPASKDSNGRARVFIPDPCTKAEVAYGVNFTDQGDAHTALFESLMDTVVLPDLRFENGTFYLEGPYVKIEDISSFEVAPATSTNGDFFFGRDEYGFEDVMVYYHVDRYQRYVQSLGFFNLQNQPVRADAHGRGDLDQSVYVPDNQGGYMLFGDGGVDDGEDADVIIHEYGHALSEAAAPGTKSGRERRGLDEGIGDYVAASYSRDLSPWNWYQIFNWDGHNEFWSGRNALSQLSYPPSNISIYTYGILWASTLMQIREELGPAVTDRLVFQEMYSNFPNMTLMDAAQLMLETDTMLYDGVHSEVLYDYFCQRKLLPGSTCATVNISPKPLETPYRLIRPSNRELKLASQSDLAAKLVLWDLSGREIKAWDQYQLNSTLSLEGLVDGIYLLTIKIDDAYYKEKIILNR
ncbi:MAG: T9SS type A sorting domain-containing protein, partial [Bacteroidota bacterium]